MSYLVAHPDIVAGRLGEHVFLVLAALAIALVIAVPLGYLAARNRRASNVVLGVAGAIYTIPSLALLALLVPVFGLGAGTALIALAAYAQVLLVRNIAEALRGVPIAAIDAATGLGMTARQRFLHVELPLALPVALGGVRIAAVSLVALATVAAWINAGGLGVLIFDGIQTDDSQKIIAGSVASAALAIAADRALRILETRVRR